MPDRPDRPDSGVKQELRRSEAGLGLQEDVVEPALPDEPALRRPDRKEPTTPAEWVKENLFGSIFSSILTIVFGLLGAWLLYTVIRFIFVGADWTILKTNIRSYMVGRFPLDELWRLWLGAYLIAGFSGFTAGTLGVRVPSPRGKKAIALVFVGAFALLVLAYLVRTPLVWGLLLAIPVAIAAGYILGRALGSRAQRIVFIGWIVMFPLYIILIRGFGGVPPRLWGGFMLNITVAYVAIALSFPIGLLLALGRRSSLPVVRLFSIAVIELVRGNPLFILLTAGAFLLPLLLPPGLSDIPLIIRAMAIFTIFSSAYVAEIVRGGLQGVAAGQYEASRALGLSTTRMMALVILPQALRATIPAMISHFISLFKDTSLLAVIGGFTDLLRSSRRASADQRFIGDQLEALLPAALIFWLVAIAMARWSQRLERKLGVGER